jgi:hypothetical protein
MVIDFSIRTGEMRCLSGSTPGVFLAFSGYWAVI